MVDAVIANEASREFCLLTADFSPLFNFWSTFSRKYFSAVGSNCLGFFSTFICDET